MSHGSTDEFGFNVAADPVHVHDLNATVLHLLGLDHERLTFKYQGRDFRLTDVHGKIVKPLSAQALAGAAAVPIFETLLTLILAKRVRPPTPNSQG